jgi:protein phosphatase
MEDLEMSKYYGLAEECQSKLKEDITSPISIFRNICDLFEYFPLAAVIVDKNVDKILCVHSGIGENTKYLEDIANVKKPCNIYDTPVAMDLVWSTPAENSNENSYTKNNFTTSLRKRYYDEAMVAEFMKNNKINLIIRSHDVLESGYDTFYNNKVISIFSATNYCNFHNNSGGILFIKKNFEIQPKILTGDENYSVWIEDSEHKKDFPPSPKRSFNKK